jgi:predicted transposase/invertase (TIGR01784 family)
MKKDVLLEKGRYARATMDCAFKAVMQDAEVRLALISDFLGRQDIVSTEPYISAVPEIRRPGRTQKYRDFVCEFKDGTKCILEMQVRRHNGWDHRAFFLSCYTFVDQLQRGADWDTLLPVVAINFLNFQTGLITKPGIFESRFMLVDVIDPRVTLPHLDMRFVEFPRVKLKNIGADIRGPWLEIFKKSHTMKEPPSYFNDAQRKMLSILEWKEWGPKMKQLYRKEKKDWSQYSIVFGEQREKGIAQGVRQGRAEGFQRGKAEGKAEGMKEMAQKMLKRNRPLQEIIEDTGLSESDILGLAL